MPNKNGELPDLPIAISGGIQSELPDEYIEPYGLNDALNMMFRLGTVRLRPNMNIGHLPAFTTDPTEPWLGIKDFYNSHGDVKQVVLTQTHLWEYLSGAWTDITPVTPMTGGTTDKFSFAVVGQKLCFSQGVDKVMLWDGLTATFDVAAAAAVPAKYMFELANHLLVGNTIEGGNAAYQRWRWTAAGDPTDWTGFNAGQEDLFNDLGPIQNGLKLYQTGYWFQQKGIVQVIPTGIGTNPFATIPLGARSKGLIAPWSLASNGEALCSYVGLDNIYGFDGTQSQPQGDYPLEGRQKGGARTRIFADVVRSNLSEIFGFVSTSINGNNYNAYWLVIPNVAIWVLNYDDRTWTRWSIDGVVSYINNWAAPKEIRIMDLIGTIAQQLWSPATLLNSAPFTAVTLGFNDGSSALFDFTGWSEKPGTIRTGQLTYGDDRHESATKKLRLVYKNLGVTNLTLTVENQEGQTEINNAQYQPPETIPLGDNSVSGKAMQTVIPINMPAEFLTVQLDIPAGSPFELHKAALVYSPSGEVK